MSPSPKGRARELSLDDVEKMKTDLRFLLHEAGWTHRGLNAALGYPATSGMLRNILYDKSGKASTTRARFEAVKRIREEQLAPGVVLIEAAPPKPAKRGAKTAATPAKNGRGRSRRRDADGLNDFFVDNEPAAQTETAAPSPVATLASDAPALHFHMNETDFTARQISDGQWQVTFTAVCSTEQMMLWNRQVVSDYLLPAVAAALAPEQTEAAE